MLRSIPLKLNEIASFEMVPTGEGLSTPAPPVPIRPRLIQTFLTFFKQGGYSEDESRNGFKILDALDTATASKRSELLLDEVLWRHLCAAASSFRWPSPYRAGVDFIDDIKNAAKVEPNAADPSSDGAGKQKAKVK